MVLNHYEDNDHFEDFIVGWILLVAQKALEKGTYTLAKKTVKQITEYIHSIAVAHMVK